MAIGAARGLGAGLGAGLATGFFRAAGTPCFIGVINDSVGIGVGLGVGFGAAGDVGVFDAGVFVAGAFDAGAFGAAATVRVFETDFAQTVTEVGPVFDEYAKPPEVDAKQAQAGIGDSW